MKPTASMPADYIQAEDISGAFPLSPIQAGMLFHSLLSPTAGIYLEQIIWRLDGEVDVPAFANAWQRVVDHHEILRTSFSWEGLERPLQIVNHQVVLPFQQHDWRKLSQLDQESRLESFVFADREAGFDFSQPPLMRVALIRLAEDSYRLILTNHHALLDGWSQSLVLKQVFSVYRALAGGAEPTLEPSPAFRNYIDWLAAQDFIEAEPFWKQALHGFTAPTSLAVDRGTTESRRDVVRHEELGLQLSVEATTQLQAFARRHRLTMFTLVQGAWALLLGRYSGTDDVVFGATVSVRPHELPDIESAAGLFINTIPVRARLPADADLLSWFKELQFETVEAREHQHSSLLDIQRWSEVPKGASLFDSILVFENYPTDDNSGSVGRGVEIQQIRTMLSRTNYPLTLLAFPGAELQLNAIYDSERFDAESMARMLGHLQSILAELVTDPARKLVDLPLLTTLERKQLLVEWNQTESEYEKDRCVYQLFEQQAALTPNSIAVEFDEQQLTYAELNTRANQLAHYLRRLGVGPESLVGICLERSPEMVVGLLGILKAGGAYLPLDPAFPKERLAFMIEDANVPVLLTEHKLTADLPAHHAQLVCIDGDWEMIARESATNPSSAATADNLAYVIYTSGSTGKPKGVQIEHRALTNFLCSVRREPGLNPGDILLSVTTLSFDIAALELYLPLIVGARLVIVSREVSADGNQLKERLRKTGATVMQATPATWRMLIDAGWKGSRQLKVLCGGEALARELADELRERSGSLWNMYGPTETTIWSSVCKIEAGDGAVSIGRPLANTQFYLLDPNLNPAPIGVAGELHIGGDGLARGYLNRPELTGEKFIRNPFSRNARARLYKTGDLARYLPDGNIECLGRLDDQVKLRGFRIELGEIESALHQHATVRESVVVAREDAPGDRRLVAYVVPANNAKIDNHELRGFLQEKLPEYMIPSVFVGLEELPLTPNGKVNRRALPAPDYDAQLHESYVAPRTPVEELLAGIWADVLKVPRVGINDNFFELGGHSLLATQLISRLRDAFQVELPLRSVFEAPTIAGLAERIEASGRSERTLPTAPIQSVPRSGEMPLSFAQERLWFIEQLEPTSSLYNVCLAARLRGPLDVEALQQALAAVVVRHETLRTNFVSLEGSSAQVISEEGAARLIQFDLRNEIWTRREAEALKLLNAEAQRPFDLACESLLRATLLRLSETENILALSIHHIVCDGWSIGILYRELCAYYDAFKRGAPLLLTKLPIQYADYACWQRDWLTGEVLQSQLRYWKDQLTGAPSLHTLTTDRPRPAVQTFNGASETLLLPVSIAEQLKSLSRREGATLFMTLLAAFMTLLARYSGQDDLVVGSPVAGRNRTEVEGLVGLFVNILALRTNLSGDPTFKELLRRVREVTLGAFAHQDLPFEQVVEEMQPERNLSHHPLLQVMFALQNTVLPALELSGTITELVEIERRTAKFDLTLEMIEQADGMLCSLEYNTDLFDARTIVGMLSNFKTLIEAVVVDSDQRISILPLLPESERHHLLVELNDTRTEYPRNCCAHEIFEEQAKRHAESVALVFGEHQVTYRELNERANQLAHYLRRLGVGPDVLVGLCLERSVEMIIGLLGILKAGGAYVPLDPLYPRERLSFMLDDTQARIVLTQARLVDSLPPTGSNLICLDHGWEQIAIESKENLKGDSTPDNLIYVMYTSGSTGQPKGVAVIHRNVVRLVKDTDYASFSSHEVFLQLAPISFDASTFEIFGSLLNGARLAIMPPQTPTLEELGRALASYKVTTLWLTAGLFHLMVDNRIEDLRSVRQLLAGGDVLSAPHIRRLLEHSEGLQLINGYGPTENTTFTCCYQIPAPAQCGDSVPIGRPIANTQVYVLDKNLQPAPAGVPGELYAGGDGVARGYFNRPDLTQERFIANPFSDEPHGRLYKTGDLARYLPDGNIEYLGRIDDQVKIRGFRIELGEIESALRQHAKVRESVVVAREDTPGDKRLVGYVVPFTEAKVDSRELREFLQNKLPEYMVPALLVELPELPLTPSGKVNRRALPAPNYDAQLQDTFVAPQTPVEELLCGIWAEVLKVSRIGINDNFFELGGHSLLAVRLFARIERLCGKHLPLATLFQAPTVAQLASVLRQEGWSAPWSALVAIQAKGRSERGKRPLFCVHAVGGNVLEYYDLARHLGPDQPFYAFQSVGLDGRQPPLKSIPAMASHYIKEMREVQPAGPYFLGGHSLGGVIAFEMACQLGEQGEQVDLLALFDTYPLGHYKLQTNANSRTYVARRFAKRMKCHIDNLLRVKGKEKFAYLADKLQFAPAKIRQQLWRRAYGLRRFNRALPATLRNIEGLNFLAAREYVPRIYPGRVALFWASGDLNTSFDLLDGWRTLAGGGVDVHELSGNHNNIVQDPHVRVLADELRACLDKAQENHSMVLRAA